MSDLVLGADLGTGALKLVALDQLGQIVADTEQSYWIERPRPGWAQIDAATWVRAFHRALGRLLSRLPHARIAALGLAGQMHGAVLVDASGAPLAPALLWPDRRAEPQLARWHALPPAERAALANPLVAGMTGPLLAWLTETAPELVQAAAGVLLPKDALRAALAPGPEPITDRSDASATLLWDVPADTWSAAALQAAGVSADLMPTVRRSDEVVGVTTVRGREVPVVAGAADTPSALFASGTRAGVQINLGTGAQLLRPLSRPRPSAAPAVHTYADVDDGWYVMSALQNGGSALTWAAEALGMTVPELLAAARAGEPGAGGAVFRPFLVGERGGVAGPHDTAGWGRLTAGTTRVDLARAAVEGLFFAIAAAFDLLDEPDDGTPIVLTGGLARSALVRQLLADVLGRTVRHLPIRSASAVGAALLAARGAGLAVEASREAGAELRPRRVPELEAARERWRSCAGREPGGTTSSLQPGDGAG